MDVVRLVGAAHVERVPGAIGAHHAERRQKLFLFVEIGGAKPPISEIGGLDHRHVGPPDRCGPRSAARRICCLARAPGASRSRALIELVPTYQLWTAVELLDPLSRFLPKRRCRQPERRFGPAVQTEDEAMKPFRLRILAQTLLFLLIPPGLARAQSAPTRHQATAA